MGIPKEFTKQDFIEKLWESHCIPLLYDIENNLAVGFYEAIYCNNVPVQLGKEFGGMEALDIALDHALDANHEDFDRKQKFIEDHSCEYNGDKFHSFVKGIMKCS